MAPWAAGSFSRTNGSKTGSTVWAQDAAAGVGIVTGNHDIHDQDLAAGINATLCKDGSNTPTANLPMGGYQHTGVGTATVPGQYVEYAQWVAQLFAAGTRILFHQAAAPTGWTQDASNNDCLIRVVSGTGGGSYTSGTAFSTVNAAATSGTIGGHAITQAELPNYNLTVTDPGHAHSYNVVGAGVGLASGNNAYAYSAATTGANTTGITVSSGGSGSTHTHTFTGSAPNINYISAIVCQKN